MRLTIYACALSLASAARASIIPIQCQRGCEVGVSIINDGVEVDADDRHDQPFPAFPLSDAHLSSFGNAQTPSVLSDASHESSFLSGDLIMSVGLEAFAETDWEGPAHTSLILAQSFVSFEFQVTSPQLVSISSRLFAQVISGSGLGEAAIHFDHDGQSVLAWFIDTGDSVQSMTWELGVGDWVINAQCEAILDSDASAPQQSRDEQASLEVRAVPAPATLLAAAFMLTAPRRRRRP